MPEELYKKYRPKRLSQILGQPQVITVVKQWLKEDAVPRAILMSGPTGTGKTTLARIMRDRLECHGRDFQEINSAQLRGIETIRNIQQRVGLSPIGDSECRIWLIDECHQLSKDGQEGFLKLLEDTPSHVYFFLATTAPNKLIAAIRNRCSKLTFKPLADEFAAELIEYVSKKAKLEFDQEVIDRIIEVSEGSARAILVSMNEIRGIEDKDEQLAAISDPATSKEAIDIARALMKPKIGWPELASILKDATGEPETIRIRVLLYAAKVLLSGGKSAARAYLIVQAFSDNYYDTKKAGLIASCWEVLQTSK